MEIETFAIDGPVLFKPRRFSDARGYFMETFRRSIFDEAVGEGYAFIQDNESLSLKAGTIRGLHFQTPPHAQGKLVRCTQGEILDVAVDIRRNSPTYGQYVSCKLSPETAHQFWIPPGFMHGFATLSENAIIQYKCTAYYAAEAEGTVAWNDPDLAIDWGVPEGAVILSDKDRDAQKFQDFESLF